MRPNATPVVLVASLAVFVLTLSAASVTPGVTAQDSVSGSASGNGSGPVDVSTDIRFENGVRAGEETTLVPVTIVNETPVSTVVSVELTMLVDGDETETQSFEERISDGTVIRREFTHTFESPGTKRVEFRGVFSALGQQVSGTVSEDITVLAGEGDKEDDGSTGGGSGESGSNRRDSDEASDTDDPQNRDETHQEPHSGNDGGATNETDETADPEESETETQDRRNTTGLRTDPGTEKAEEGTEAPDSTDGGDHQKEAEEPDEDPEVAGEDADGGATNGSSGDRTAGPYETDTGAGSDGRSADGQENHLPGFTAGFAVVVLLAAALYARSRYR